MTCVRVFSSASARLKPYLDRLLAYENVPRKKAKFINFAKNSLNLKADREGIADQLWEIVGDAAPTAAQPSGGESAVAAVATPLDMTGAAPGKAADVVANVKEVVAEDEVKGEAEGEVEGKVAKKRSKEEKAAAKAAKAEAKEAKAAAKVAKAEAADTADKDKVKEVKDAEAAVKTAARAEAKAIAKEGGKKRKRDVVDEASAKGEGGKEGGKPIKWKKLIAKELEESGGHIQLKALRKATVAEAQAHPSYKGRPAKDLKEEFDRILPTFHKFIIDGGQVKLAPQSADKN